MPNTYFDPAGALPKMQDYNMTLPFGQTLPSALGAQAAATQRATMSPFIQRAGQADELELEKQRQLQQEFMSREAMGSRMSKYRADEATNTQTALSAPSKGELERAQARRDTALAPAERDRKLAELRQATIESNSTPQREFYQMMAGQYEAMRDTKSDMERAAMHKAMVERWKQKYGSTPVPPELESYHGGTLSVYKTMNNIANMTPEYFQKRMEQQEATKRTGMEQAGASQRTTATIEGRAPVNLRLRQVQTQLTQLPANSPKRAALESERDTLQIQDIEDTVDKELAKPDWTNPIMATDMGPKIIQNYLSQRQGRVMEIKIKRGVPVDISDLKAMYPGVDEKTIRERAKARNIKVKD